MKNSLWCVFLYSLIFSVAVIAQNQSTLRSEDVAPLFYHVYTETALYKQAYRGFPLSADVSAELSINNKNRNRIEWKTIGKFYRDNEGRTLREPSVIPPILRNVSSNLNDVNRKIVIIDPVGQRYHTLDPLLKNDIERECDCSKLNLEKTPEKNGSPQRLVIGNNIKMIKPEYPQGIKNENFFGTIVVDIVIDENGKVKNAKSDDGPKLLRESAIAAVKQWTFEPSFKDGKPIKFKRSIAFDCDQSKGEFSIGKISVVRSGKTPLGKSFIDGVEAEGTARVYEVPAMGTGNAQPINIVVEQWYSSKFQVIIMTRIEDPRIGTYTYKLTNINNTPPLASVFDIPEGYQKIDNRKVERPKILTKKPAKYTDEARHAKINGIIILKIVFNADGTTSIVSVIRGLPNGLTESAIDAARNIRFEPVMEDGKPVAYVSNIEYNFSLY